MDATVPVMSSVADSHFSASAEDAVGKLLVKRVRLHTSILPVDAPQKKYHKAVHLPPVDSPVGVQDCHELCSLLLQKVGVDISRGDEVDLDKLLTTEYPPRVAELLARITGALEKKTITTDAASVVSDASDDDESDAIVPGMSTGQRTTAIKTDNAVLDNVVPVAVPYVQKDLKDPRADLTVKAPVLEVPAPAASYKKDTEIAISRIFDLGKVAAVEDPTIPADSPYHGPSVVTMTGFGELGRFGNQMLQYAFLLCYAKAHNISEVQVPAWVGAGLFGLRDRTVQRALPSVVEFRNTRANSTFTTDFIDYVKASSPTGDMAELGTSCLLASASGSSPPVNVDIWGWFQWHTSKFAPFKQLIQEKLAPVPAISEHLAPIFDRGLRFRGGVRRTVVGLHLRLGDYQSIAASSFGYCAPTTWYLEWLAKIWPTLENPVLFVASDDLDAVLRDFSAYSPVTADSIGMTMPDGTKHLRAGFFPDWYSLTQCDVLAISNSTFSFTACMMNKQPNARFYRGHYADRMVPMNPWNADPIVHRDMNKNGVSSALETLQVLYNTQGPVGVARNVLYELPYYGVRAAIMKAVLWRQARSNLASAVST